MSFWGVFKVAADEVHVAPCAETGEVLEPHELDTGCRCRPIPCDQAPGLWTHQDPERGGFDA